MVSNQSAGLLLSPVAGMDWLRSHRLTGVRPPWPLLTLVVMVVSFLVLKKAGEMPSHFEPPQSRSFGTSQLPVALEAHRSTAPNATCAGGESVNRLPTFAFRP